MSKFDIEKFPTSETAKRMLRRVSPIYGSSYVAKWLYQVMGLELDEAAAIIKSLRDQNFTKTVTWAIEYQEHKYSITPNDNLSLEERRAQLYRKKTEKYPLNPRRAELYFKNGWEMDVDIDETVDYGYIKLTLISRIPESIVEAIKDFRRIKPSHLTLIIESKREAESTIYVGSLPSLHRRYIVGPKRAEDTEVAAVFHVGASASVHQRITVPPRVNTINEARATPRVGGIVGVHKRVSGGVMNNG